MDEEKRKLFSAIIYAFIEELGMSLEEAKAFCEKLKQRMASKEEGK